MWWCCLLRDSTTNVILPPGVSMLEVEKFVGKICGEFNFSPNNDENDTFHGFTEAEIDTAASKSFDPIGEFLYPPDMIKDTPSDAEGSTPVNVVTHSDIDSNQSLSREENASYWRPWLMLRERRGRRLRR